MDNPKFNLARAVGWIFIVGFISAVLVDIDHPLGYWLGISQRFQHEIYFVGGAIAILIGGWLCFTFYRRLSRSWILRGVK